MRREKFFYSQLGHRFKKAVYKPIKMCEKREKKKKKFFFSPLLAEKSPTSKNPPVKVKAERKKYVRQKKKIISGRKKIAGV